MGDSVVNESHIDMLQKQIAHLEERMIDPREFGRMEQQVEQMAKQMEQMNAALVTINATLSEAKGGWRVLMLAAGAGSAVTGVAAWALQYLRVAP